MVFLGRKMGVCKGTEAWKDGDMSRKQRTHVLRSKAMPAMEKSSKDGEYGETISGQKGRPG